MKNLYLALFVVSAILVGCKSGAGPRPDDPLPQTVGVDSAKVQTILKRVEASNARRWDDWQALHTDTCVRTAPDLERPVAGSAAMRRDIERLSAAFPEYHIGVSRIVGTGDWVSVLFTSWGKFTQNLKTKSGFEIWPSNKAFYQKWVAFVRFEGDRIAEFHEFWDTSDVNNQVMGFSDPKPW